MARIGLISDTHGLLREEAVAALRGCELIIHAGDVGKGSVLDALRKIAPVTAVRGNVDTAGACASLPRSAVVEGGIYVLHNLRELAVDPAAYRMVVSGHTHKPVSFEKDGVLYVNPGSAGPRRFKLPITVARFDSSASPWRIEFIDLDR